MKKLVLILMACCIVTIIYANSSQDSVPNLQISKEVVEKLSNEELIQLIKDVEYIKSTHNIKFTDDKKNFALQHLSSRDFVKGFIISLMIFIISLISIAFFFNYIKTKSFHRLINSFIARDKEIPSNIVLSTYKTRSDLQKSIILIAVGFAVAIVLPILEIGEADRIWSIGLIPGIIGIGYFVSSRFDR
jgi:hypothetical protein